MAYIYILTNNINNKKYIGQTVDYKRRFEKYKYNISQSNQYILKAIKKYGWDSFSYSIYLCPIFLLDFIERFLIKLLNTLAPNGYNLETGGNKNKTFCKETCEKISIASKGENNAFYGKKHSLDSKLKMSDSRKEYYKNNDAYWKGKKLPEEVKVKLSEAHIGVQARENHPKAKKVICLETMEVFNCMKDAEEKHGVTYANISCCCRGITKTAGGFHWMYYEDYLKLQEAS